MAGGADAGPAPQGVLKGVEGYGDAHREIGGRFVTTRRDALPQAERGIRVLLTRVGPDGAMLTTLSGLAAVGDLALRVAETCPLREAAQAYARMTRGGLQRRVVLTMD
ncbi:hypothetical protein [Streptomyces sp. NBC_01314]|uniref:hypothetical protein n=1 Tax=Streptomyces sp. NBC_01314 TaxID=2903821 RepID=UPI0030872131|nr:hypothetical protein OG622_46820 [Streptomyces sp. NBC_01314]